MKTTSAFTEDAMDSPTSPVEPGRISQLLQGWYRIASPPEPASSASFEQREQFRRGRTGSQVALVVLVICISAFPAAFRGTNLFLVAILSVGLLAIFAAIALNRMGYVTQAGILVVVAITASPATDILTTPGGLNPSVLPVFSILVLPLMCVVSLLPARWVFVFATGNSLFTLYTMTLMPHSAELNAILKVAFISIVTPIILSHLIVSVVAYLWVTGAIHAIRRADRAEEIAQLEHALAVNAEITAQQKEQLETSIQKIVETNTRVANGDLDARVPLTKDNVLWQVSSSLNNFLSRLQRSRQELQQLRTELAQSREENNRLRNLLL
jgi:hypothetical protein